MRQISLQGHRGARGLLAENTLPSLLKPFEYGMDGIEFDLQLSRDNQLVIHHDLCLKPSITRDAHSRWLKKPGPAIHHLELRQLRKFRLGKVNRSTAYGFRFRGQQAIDDQRIPTLYELIEALDKNDLNSVLLNIELKHSPLHPELCPRPAVLACQVVEEIHRLGLAGRCIVQCFNWEVLREVREIDASLPVSCLTMVDKKENTVSALRGRPSAWTGGLDIRDFNSSAARMVSAFGADYWSAYFRNLTRKEIDIARNHGLKLMAWTVNNPSIMKKIFDRDVDVVISDYPNRLQQAWNHWRYE